MVKTISLKLNKNIVFIETRGILYKSCYEALIYYIWANKKLRKIGNNVMLSIVLHMGFKNLYVPSSNNCLRIKASAFKFITL